MPDNPLNKQWPRVPLELAAFLDQRFPEQCPDRDDNGRGIWMYAGKRELVRLLLHISKKQEDALYETP